MALGILQITIQYCCASVTCPSVMLTPSISAVTAHFVCSIYTTNFYHLERKGFQHKNYSSIFINFDRMYL